MGYLIGFGIAFLIEVLGGLRVGQFCVLRSLFFSLFSWLYVGWFAVWVFDAMGWQYEQMKNPGPYECIVWRLYDKDEPRFCWWVNTEKSMLKHYGKKDDKDDCRN